MQQTEFPFTLPHGYVDSEGNLHREGVMRLSTTYDEQRASMRDPDYFMIVLLSRVIFPLGTLPPAKINPTLIENLVSADLIYLQDFCERINQKKYR